MSSPSTSKYWRCFLCRKKFPPSQIKKNINTTVLPASNKYINVVLQHLARLTNTELHIPSEDELCITCYNQVSEYDQTMIDLVRKQRELSKIVEKAAVSLDSDFEVEEEYEEYEFTALEEELIEHVIDDTDVSDDEISQTMHEAMKEKKIKITRERSSSASPPMSPEETTTIHKCHSCDETFVSRRKYVAHVNKEHFSGYMCEVCGKTLYSNSGFINHLRSHQPDQYTCMVCGASFSREPNLQRHMAWHSGEKPFQCEICAKRFVHKVALQKHMQIHDSSTRKIECGQCDFKFRTKAHLKRHMKTHTGEKPHCCPFCGKFFAQSYNMKVHVQEHENPGSSRRQRRFNCLKCSEVFSNKQGLEEHEKKCYDTTYAPEQPNEEDAEEGRKACYDDVEQALQNIPGNDENVEYSLE